MQAVPYIRARSISLSMMFDSGGHVGDKNRLHVESHSAIFLLTAAIQLVTRLVTSTYKRLYSVGLTARRGGRSVLLASMREVIRE